MPYDHDTYWDTMVEMCLRRRKEQEEKFRRGPAAVGREERDWRTQEPVNRGPGTSAAKPLEWSADDVD
jgi:hypothetical protein